MVIGDEYSNWRAGSKVRESLMSTPRTRVVFAAAPAGPGSVRSQARPASAATTASVAASRRGRRPGRQGERQRDEGRAGIVDLRVAASLGAGWRVSERYGPGRGRVTRRGEASTLSPRREGTYNDAFRVLRRQPSMARIAGRTELVADYAAYFCGEWMPFSEVR